VELLSKSLSRIILMHCVSVRTGLRCQRCGRELLVVLGGCKVTGSWADSQKFKVGNLQEKLSWRRFIRRRPVGNTGKLSTLWPTGDN